MDELVELALRHTTQDGINQTRIPQLQILRNPVTSVRVHAVHTPMLCYLAQGAKEMTVAGKVYRYAAHEYLVSTVDLPITGEVVEATRKRPYLCWAVVLEPRTVHEVLRDGALEAPRSERPGIFVGRGDAVLGDAVLRLARCLDDPADEAVLGPAIVREIVYRLLRGRFGAVVRELGVSGGRTERVSRAVERLKNDFAAPLRVEALARVAGMSTSSFHEHFKKLTTLSPLQYQKQLRLQEARRLLLGAGEGAAEVAFRVGYQSPSQFSREYARFFGRPPMADARGGEARGR